MPETQFNYLHQKLEHFKPYAKTVKVDQKLWQHLEQSVFLPTIFDSLSFKRQKFFQAPYNKVNVTFFHNFLLHETPKILLGSSFFDSMLI